MTTTRILAAAALIAAPAMAQQQIASAAATPQTPAAATTDSATKEKDAKASKKAMLYKPQVIQHIRLNDQRGIGVFEAPKEEGVPFTGFKYDFGAAFAQEFQGLGHVNAADSVRTSAASATNANRLVSIGHGFDNAMANLYLNAQLAKGVRVALTSYLSTRHHNETWVKDGYFLIDDSPIDWRPLNKLMSVLSVKAGHFEINYGDQHFRRTDAGQAMYNPLVGNLPLEDFSTEVGGELYARSHGFLAMGAVTNGEVRGTILTPVKRSPAVYGKLGYDKQLTGALRVRLTGSAFSQDRSANQTLFTGSRAGSRYYDVLENTASTESANAWSGDVRPDFSELHAQVINPFLKYRGLEYFGNFEQAKGRTLAEQLKNATTPTDAREVTQVANELTYRFLGDQLYVSGRAATVSGKVTADLANDVTVKRNQLGAGWFLTPTVLLKGEYVKQTYDGYAATSIFHGGQFEGFMLEGTVAF